jgi:hypothetical protein
VALKKHRIPSLQQRKDGHLLSLSLKAAENNFTVVKAVSSN